MYLCAINWQLGSNLPWAVIESTINNFIYVSDLITEQTVTEENQVEAMKINMQGSDQSIAQLGTCYDGQELKKRGESWQWL